jgi:hypothetical protein
LEGAAIAIARTIVTARGKLLAVFLWLQGGVFRLYGVPVRCLPPVAFLVLRYYCKTYTELKCVLARINLKKAIITNRERVTLNEVKQSGVNHE